MALVVGLWVVGVGFGCFAVHCVCYLGGYCGVWGWLGFYYEFTNLGVCGLVWYSFSGFWWV